MSEPTPAFTATARCGPPFRSAASTGAAPPEPDGSTGQKYGWWTVGTKGGLAIEGRRLDAVAPAPLRARVNRGWPQTPFADVPGGRFWSSAVSFPTEGCWQVTGRVGATSLTFVVLMPN